MIQPRNLLQKFVLEYKDGNDPIAIGWKQLAQGRTVGYKRLLRFKEITAKQIRLRIISSGLNPTLSEFGLYKLAK